MKDEIQKHLITSNLAKLLPQNCSYFDELVEHEPVGTIATQTEDGQLVILRNGKPIADERNPKSDAMRFLDGSSCEDAQFWLILGIGNGYLVEGLLSQNRHARAIIIEPDRDILVTCLQSRALQVPAHRVKLITSLAELRENWFFDYRMSRPISILAEDWYQKHHSDILKELQREVSKFVNFARISDSTANHRLKQWAKNLLHNLKDLGKRLYIGAFQGMFEGVPAVIVAAGPSLDKNIHLLKGLEDRVLIITMNSAYEACIKAGVKPHICMSIESYNVNSFFAGLPVNDTVFIAMHTSDPSIADLGFRHVATVCDSLPFFRDFCGSLGDTFTIPNGGSVATAAWQLAHLLGCSQVICIGQDLGYSDDGQMYSRLGSYADLSVSFDEKKKILELHGGSKRKQIYLDSGKSEDEMQNRIQYRFEPSWDGNGTCRTTDDFIMFRDWFSFTALDYPGKCYNCTEGGLRIENMIHQPLAEVLSSLPLDRPNPWPDLVAGFPRLEGWSEAFQEKLYDWKSKLNRLQILIDMYLESITAAISSGAVDWTAITAMERKIYERSKEITILHAYTKADLSALVSNAFSDAAYFANPDMEKIHLLRCKAFAEIIRKNISEIIEDITPPA